MKNNIKLFVFGFSVAALVSTGLFGGYIYLNTKDIEAQGIAGVYTSSNVFPGDESIVNIIDPWNIVDLPPDLRDVSYTNLEPIKDGNPIFFDDKNFEIQIPKDWKEGDSSFVDKIYGFNSEKYFINSDNSCALVYSYNPEVPNGLSHHTQELKITLFNEEDQVVGTKTVNAIRNILLSKAPRKNLATTTPTFVFMGGGKEEPYLPYEFAGFYIGRQDIDNNNFFVVSPNDRALSMDCEIEVRRILLSYSQKFEDTTLAKESDGFVFMNFENQLKQNGLLLLSPIGLDTLKKVVELPVRSRDVVFSEGEQSFYLIDLNSSNNGIVRFALQEDEEFVVTDEYSRDDLKILSGNSITDLNVYGDNMYYLSGDFGCGSYLGDCNASLYKYNKTSKIAELVINNVKSNRIIGFSKNGYSILLGRPSVDSGCWSNKYTKVDVVNKKSVSAGQFSGCDGIDSSDDIEGQDVLLKEFSEGNGVNVNGLIWVDGRLTRLVESQNYHEKFSTKITERTGLTIYPFKVIK